MNAALLRIRWGFLVALLLSLWLVGVLWTPAWQEGSLRHSPRLLAGGILLLLIGLVQAAFLGISFSLRGRNFLIGMTTSLAMRLSALGKKNLLWLVILFCSLAFWMAGDYSWYFSSILRRLPLLFTYAGLTTLILKGWLKEYSWFKLGVASLLFTAAILRLSVFLADVTDYPFSLTWSETTRFYYASLFFSERLYGERFAWPPYDASRAILQAIPFFFAALPLWVHRLWQALLWIGIAVLTAIGVARRFEIQDTIQHWAFMAATILWFLLSPVYFQLQLVVWLVCAFLPRHFWERRFTSKTLLLLAVASMWSGLSRINWFPMPALLAALLYVLEKPQSEQPPYRYFAQPIGWILFGSLIAAATQAVYILLSGAEAHTYGYIFTSKILWYRLLPNPTFPTGILPSAIFVSLPVLIWIGWQAKRMALRLGFWRWLALVLMLIALFGGGIVVSAKIGGGNNLHNLDAYWVILWLLAAAVTFGVVKGEKTDSTAVGGALPSRSRPYITAILLSWILLELVFSALNSGAPRLLYNRAEVEADLDLLKQAIQSAGQQGEVLFLTERQLITFGYLPNISLVPQYDKVFLMEMAMAHNQAYMNQFHEDLRAQRFSLIVSDPLRLRKKGTTAHFGDENDYWVDEVATPILCYYEPKKLLRTATIRWYVPRAEVLSCP